MLNISGNDDIGKHQGYELLLKLHDLNSIDHKLLREMILLETDSY